MNANVELLILGVSLVLIGLIYVSVYRFRKQRGIRWLLGLIVCRFVYASSVILEKNVQLLDEQLFFRNMQNTAINMMVPLWLFFVLEWVFPDRRLALRWKVVVTAMFILWSSQMWLPDSLNPIYHSIDWVDGHLLVNRTAYSMTFSMLCFIIIAGSFFLLLQYIFNLRQELRTPGLLLVALASVLVVLEMIKVANPQWSSWLIPLTVYCGFCGTLMLLIMLRHRFFTLAPFARNFALETLQESIVIANVDGQVIDTNKQADRWFALLGIDVVNERALSNLLKPWPDWLALCQNMQQSCVEVEAVLDGEKRAYQVNIYPLQTPGKPSLGSLSLIMDVTEQKRQMEQIANLNQLKDQLITIVSHDIRGPLALQYQLVELLEQDELRPEHREIVAQLGSQIRHTLGMSTNVLEWFRSQREDMLLRTVTLDLAEAVEESIEMLQVYADSKQVRVEHSVHAGIWVQIDREMLGLILRNLLSNAIKFTSSGGWVQVGAQLSQENGVIIVVQDNGIGMDQERMRMLFSQSPMRSESGTAGEMGAGLGLLVTRQFIERSGERFWLESCQGEGSSFYFTVKRAVFP